MNERDFFYWLQGFFELSESDTLSKKQVQVIKDHMALVATKVTPDRKGPWPSEQMVLDGIWGQRPDGPVAVTCATETPLVTDSQPLLTCGYAPGSSSNPLHGEPISWVGRPLCDCSGEIPCVRCSPQFHEEDCTREKGCKACKTLAHSKFYTLFGHAKHGCMRLANPDKCICTEKECKPECACCVDENIKQMMDVPTVVSC